MKDKDLSKEQSLDVLKMTVDGRGWFPRNRAIYHFTEELNSKYFYSKEDLYHSVIEHINSNKIVRKNGTKLGTHYTNIVYYYLHNLVRKERNKLKNVRVVSIFDSNRIAGHYNDHIIDTLTDSITPESDLIEKQFIAIVRDFFSPLELDCLLGFNSIKESAVEAGNNYEYYCKRLKQKIVKVRIFLKQEGYEREDFINLGEKRPLLVPS
jgi:hypothetical protein